MSSSTGETMVPSLPEKSYVPLGKIIIRFEDLNTDLLDTLIVVSEHHRYNIPHITKKLYSQLKRLFPWNSDSLYLNRLKQSTVRYNNGKYYAMINLYDLYSGYTMKRYPDLSSFHEDLNNEYCSLYGLMSMYYSKKVNIQKNSIVTFTKNALVIQDGNKYYVEWIKYDDEYSHLKLRNRLEKFLRFDYEDMLLKLNVDIKINISVHPWGPSKKRPVEKISEKDDVSKSLLETEDMTKRDITKREKRTVYRVYPLPKDTCLCNII